MPGLMRGSVVVVTYNHRGIISSCLDALSTTIGPNDEVIVVDNASSDATAEYVADHYPLARVIRSAANAGFGAGCNRGARAAQGRCLIFLNPDTQPQAGWLDALLAGLQAVPNAGLATGKLLLARAPNRIDAFGNEVHISGITTSRGWGEPAARYDRLEEVAAISGACLAVGQDTFERLGGFDERLFLYFEDTDLSLRARLAGLRCIAVPDALVLHDHRPGFSPVKLRYLERNRWWTLLKLLEWRTIFALAPVLLLAEILAWAMAVRGGPHSVIAKALAWKDLVGWLPELRQARTRVGANRVVKDSRLLTRHVARLPFSQLVDGAAARGAETICARAFGAARRMAVAIVP